MNKTLAVGNLVATGAMLTALSVPGLAQQKSIKISFVSTFSGPPARIGNMRNSLELALDHLGRKMGSLPIQVISKDGQQRLQVRRQKIEKLIEPGSVDFVLSGPSSVVAT